LPGAGVVVYAQRVDREGLPASKRVYTDNQGYYLLPDLPEGKYNIWAELDGFVVKALDSKSCGDETAVPDLHLIRGGTISGRVIDAETGARVEIPPPLAGFIGLHGPSRPESGSGIAIAPIMDDGTFFIRAAPGKNYVYLTGIHAIENGRHVTIGTWVDVAAGQMIDVELKVPSNELAD
jgi:hypothetical protein